MAEIRSAFGRAVRAVRKSRRLTQMDLSQRTGLDQGYISEIERGYPDLPLSTQERVASGLGLTLPELMELADAERPGRTPGRLLRWEMALPDHYRTLGPSGIRWAVARVEEGRWKLMRWGQAEPNPVTIDTYSTLGEGQQAAEEGERREP